MKVLILGGTAEAAALAEAATLRPGLVVISSLAGVSAAPRPLPGRVRVGGFGGAAGLADFLNREGIDRLVDATHPFAARIGAQAAAAADRAGVPRLKLVRPAWQAEPGDRWTVVADLAGAVAGVPPAPITVCLALGARTLAAFAERPEPTYLVRVLQPPESPLPLPRVRVLAVRDRMDPAAELALLRTHHVEQLVCRNSGGTHGLAKLTAARACAVPVTMIDRPPVPPGPTVPTVEAVLSWL